MDPITAAASALTADEAWTPLLPAEAQAMVRLSPADEVLLYHPLGQIQVRQISIPLEMDIDRIGSSKSTRKRINLRAPTLGGAAAGAVWPLTDRFAPGHFLTLSDHDVLARPEFEERASGLGMGATQGAGFSTAVQAGYAWKTDCPNEDFDGPTLDDWNLAHLSAKVLGRSAKMRIKTANPYVTVGPRPEEIAVAPRGEVAVVSADTLAGAFGSVAMPASAAAAAVHDGDVTGVRLTTLSAGFM